MCQENSSFLSFMDYHLSSSNKVEITMFVFAFIHENAVYIISGNIISALHISCALSVLRKHTELTKTYGDTIWNIYA